ncbi:unnamed protein product, partial [Polarella glacialis]
VAAAAALFAAGGGQGAVGRGGSQASANRPSQQPKALEPQLQQQQQWPPQSHHPQPPKRRGYRPDLPGGAPCKPRVPRAPGVRHAVIGNKEGAGHLAWNARESQVALWLDNIRPRKP